MPPRRNPRRAQVERLAGGSVIRRSSTSAGAQRDRPACQTHTVTAIIHPPPCQEQSLPDAPPVPEGNRVPLLVQSGGEDGARIGVSRRQSTRTANHNAAHSRGTARRAPMRPRLNISDVNNDLQELRKQVSDITKKTDKIGAMKSSIHAIEGSMSAIRELMTELVKDKSSSSSRTSLVTQSLGVHDPLPEAVTDHINDITSADDSDGEINDTRLSGFRSLSLPLDLGVDAKFYPTSL